jgi:uncharacterized protein YggT (Ycf19 family)
MQVAEGPAWLRQLRSRFGARGFVSRVVQLIRLVALLVEAVIALRILLRVAGANPKAGFSSFVDGLSAPFVGPFHPVFADQLVNGHPLEVGSLLAMAVCAILGYAAVRVIRAAFSPAHL